MWVRLTFSRIAPADLEDARKLYASPFVSHAMETQTGHRFHYWLESADRPGEVISLSAWDTRADAEAYEKGDVYAELGAKFQEWFQTEREVRSYEVHE